MGGQSSFLAPAALQSPLHHTDGDVTFQQEVSSTGCCQQMSGRQLRVREATQGTSSSS